MNPKKVIVVYKSSTGFTKKYAEMVAEELSCAIADYRTVTAALLSEYDTVIFGTRAHAGMIDGYRNAKKMFGQSTAGRLLLFVTGAMPNAETDVVEGFWHQNLTPEELSEIPHFYMQSGLCYEKMGFGDKAMMKVASIMIGRKKKKTEDEKAFEKAISGSYDISSKEYAVPLIDLLKKTD